MQIWAKPEQQQILFHFRRIFNLRYTLILLIADFFRQKAVLLSVFNLKVFLITQLARHTYSIPPYLIECFNAQNRPSQFIGSLLKLIVNRILNE